MEGQGEAQEVADQKTKQKTFELALLYKENCLLFLVPSPSSS
jgi:hypothetical protein